MIQVTVKYYNTNCIDVFRVVGITRKGTVLLEDKNGSYYYATQKVFNVFCKMECAPYMIKEVNGHKFLATFLSY